VKIVPRIPKKLSIVEEALSEGRYEACPDIDPDFPNIQEPQQNPNRNSQVVKWNPRLMSYELPDGAMWFCDLLQSNDPQKKWETTEPGDFTKNEEIEELFNEA
jgi:hypothetical protein